jgi:Domain of unknown function (DUF4272)
MEDNELRSAKEITIRCIIINEILFIVHGGATGEQIQDLLKSWGLMDFVTNSEKIFLSKENHSQIELDKTSWKRESLFALLWTLGEVENLSEPNTESDIPSEVFLKLESNPLSWINEATLRSEYEISKAAEDIYQIHWLVRDAILNNRPIPNNYNPNIVYYRHHAMNWVEKYNDDNWDDISVDT